MSQPSYLVLTQMDHASDSPVVCGVFASFKDLEASAQDFLGCMPFDAATDAIAVAPFRKHYSDIPDMDLYATGELLVVRDGLETPTGLYVWNSAERGLEGGRA